MRADTHARLVACLGVLVVGSACSTPSSPRCPPGTAEDAAHAAALERRLGTVTEGAALLDGARTGIARICFGEQTSSSVITRDRVVILARGLEESEAAARLGHLLVHARDGLPIDAVHGGVDEGTCEAEVGEALALEARAYVTEIALQDALGAQPRLLAFEFAADVRAAPASSRERVVLAYLRAHPRGGPGIDGLADAYRLQCR